MATDGCVRKALPSSFFGFWIRMDTSSVWMEPVCIFRLGCGWVCQATEDTSEKRYLLAFWRFWMDPSISGAHICFSFFLEALDFFYRRRLWLNYTRFCFDFSEALHFFLGVFDKITLLRRDMSCLAWRLVFLSSWRWSSFGQGMAIRSLLPLCGRGMTLL
jgi:hypothetical protein